MKDKRENNTKMRKTINGAILLIVLLSPAARLCAQYKTTFELGSIISTSLKKSDTGRAPLIVNNGNATFLNKWVLFAGAQLNENISVYAEIQTLKGFRFANYGMSLMYRPSDDAKVNLEVGKFLVPFGRFLERRWASENPFVDFPLIYEYRTALSAFDLPANASELLRVRGRGDAFQYHTEDGSLQKHQPPVLASGHLPARGAGLRMVSREVYLTGFQLFGTVKGLKYHLGLTNGALSNPADINNSNGLQVHGRIAATPTTGLEIGSSFSSGVYLQKSAVQPTLQAQGRDTEDYRQSAVGLDMSYAYGHLVLFAEVMLNRWQTPFIADDLDVLAFYVEGKYRWLAHFYSAVRLSAMDFAHIPDPLDVDGDSRLSESWDYDIYQFEAATGYFLSRNALLKVLLQLNRTLGVPTGDPRDDLLALQLAVFF